MRYLTQLILLSSLLSCSWFNQEQLNTISPEIVIEIPLPESININNNNSALLAGDNLYYSGQGFFLRANNLRTGEGLWHVPDIYQAYRNPAIWNDMIVISEGRYILFIEKDTGIVSGSINIHDSSSVEDRSLCSDWIDSTSDEFYNDTDWLSIIDDILYMSIEITDEGRTKSVKQLVFLDLSLVEMNPDEPTVLDFNILYETNINVKFRTTPLFKNGYLYFLAGGGGWKLDEDEPLTDITYYHQSDLSLFCMELSSKEIVWETKFDYCGRADLSAGNLQFWGEEHLVLCDWGGFARIQRETGLLDYEFPGDSGSGSMGSGLFTIEGDYVYTSASYHLRCVHIPSGEVIWKDTNEFTRDFKPVVYGNKLYIVDSDALRVYNKRTGELLGINSDLGVSGYRYQHYMPVTNDVLYIMKSDKIVGIRME